MTTTNSKELQSCVVKTATIEVPYFDIDGKDAERVRRHAERNEARRIKQRRAAGRKLATVMVAIMTWTFAMLVYCQSLGAIYEKWCPDFYDFLIISMFLGFAVLCIFAAIFGYIREKIYNED